MSVDRSYRSGSDFQKAEATARKIFAKLKLDWPNVFVPEGWQGVLRTFNAHGYGKILVDPQGIVRGTDLRGDQVESLLKAMLAKP